MGRAPYLHYTLAFALQLKKNCGKRLSAFPKASYLNCLARFDKFACLYFGIDLDWPVEPGGPWLARQATGVNPRSE